ncbi:MAG: hypothetical protein ACTSVA_03270 [Candidatus Njordarchaeales archaeon]
MPEDARGSSDPWSKSPHFYYLSEDSRCSVRVNARLKRPAYLILLGQKLT